MELSEQTGAIITILGVFLANAAIIISLFVWNRSESRNDNRQIVDMFLSIKNEIKDFHGRLERQDAEFKSHMTYLHDGKNKSS